jgi:hypothetical protein
MGHRVFFETFIVSLDQGIFFLTKPEQDVDLTLAINSTKRVGRLHQDTAG